MSELLFFVTIAIFLFALIIVMISSLVLNLRHTNQIRIHLTKQVKRLRLNKMLRILGIKVEDFTHRAELSDVTQAIQQCEACPAVKQCDENLSNQAPASNYVFCPNQANLLRIRSEFGEQTSKD